MITINDSEFNMLVGYVKENFGILLKNKRSLIEGRLSNILHEKGYDNYSDFLNNALNDKTGTEITLLIDKLTTNHTFFMREPVHFNFYKEDILPNVVKKSKENDLRVWSAGCSSGQEPYTIAMINEDFFGMQKNMWDTKILATDISSRALDKAKNGTYSSEEIADLNANWRHKHFKKTGENNFVISDRIKNEIIFRKFNLMDEYFPFKKKFHVIFCRNVMIYFDNDTKLELVNKFYELLEPGGYLFIGHSESIDRRTTRFKYIMPAIYLKE